MAYDDDDDGGDSSSTRSAARTALGGGGDGVAEHELAMAVRGVVGRTPQVSLDEVCERLGVLGLEADRAEVKKALSKAKRELARGGGRPVAAPQRQPSPYPRDREKSEDAIATNERDARDDAVAGFDAEMAVWMRANGVNNPSAAEAARLRLLSDRLVEQRTKLDFDGAVATWLETNLGSGIMPTRLEQKIAAKKMEKETTKKKTRLPDMDLKSFMHRPAHFVLLVSKTEHQFCIYPMGCRIWPIWN